MSSHINKNAFLIELSESDRTDFGRLDFDGQSEPQKIFSAVWSLESQVNNGGFAQYFQSFDGETGNFAPTALRRIGAGRCGEIVERAIAIVSASGLPASQEERERLVLGLKPEFVEHLEKLDGEFYAYPDNLTELLFRFVVANPAAFGPVA